MMAAEGSSPVEPAVFVFVFVRPAALKILAAGWVFSSQRRAALLFLLSYTTTTLMWTRSQISGTLPDSLSCESL